MSVLNIKNLKVSIGRKVFFKNLNLTFSPGQVWGILGPNGAGKTTLLHVLAGLQLAEEGEVFLNDRNILDLKPKARAQKIGVLLQSNVFSFPGTALETVIIGRYPHTKNWFKDDKQDKILAREILKQMELDEFADRDVTSLSGGEQQRLSISTLFMQDPDVYLLDEPTNHLDIKQQLHILALFKKLASEEKKTIIMILHDINLLRTFCDHIMVIGQNNELMHGKCFDMLQRSRLKKFFSPEVMPMIEECYF